MFDESIACSVSNNTFFQVTVLTRKLDAQSQFSTQRRRGDESAKPLQFEIQRLKAHKVTLT